MSHPDQATGHTKSLHERACRDPVFDWQDRRDFEFAARGLIHRPEYRPFSMATAKPPRMTQGGRTSCKAMRRGHLRRRR